MNKSKNMKSLQETKYLVANKVDKVVNEREKDNSGFTEVDNIDWNKI